MAAKESATRKASADEDYRVAHRESEQSRPDRLWFDELAEVRSRKRSLEEGPWAGLDVVVQVKDDAGDRREILFPWVFASWYQLRGVRVPADLHDRASRFVKAIEAHDGAGSVSADGVQVAFSLTVQAFDESGALEAGMRIASKAAADAGLDKDHRLGGDPSIVALE